MLKRLTVTMDDQHPNYKTLAQWLVEYGVDFNMEKIDAPAMNGHHRSRGRQKFGKDLTIQATDKQPKGLTASETKTYDALIKRYGKKPFRKGEGSKYVVNLLGAGSSSCLSHLCKDRYFAPSPQQQLPLSK